MSDIKIGPQVPTSGRVPDDWVPPTEGIQEILNSVKSTQEKPLCERCEEWSKQGLSDTCPACDIVSETQEKPPREWYVDVNEWLTETENDCSGHAFTKGWLEQMEMQPHKMVHVIEYSAYEALRRERDAAMREANEKAFKLDEARAALEFTLAGLAMWRKYQSPGNIAEVEERIRETLAKLKGSV